MKSSKLPYGTREHNVQFPFPGKKMVIQTEYRTTVEQKEKSDKIKLKGRQRYSLFPVHGLVPHKFSRIFDSDILYGLRWIFTGFSTILIGLPCIFTGFSTNFSSNFHVFLPDSRRFASSFDAFLPDFPNDFSSFPTAIKYFFPDFFYDFMQITNTKNVCTHNAFILDQNDIMKHGRKSGNQTIKIAFVNRCQR